MTRISTDQLDDAGFVWAGYDYHLQVWVEYGLVVVCGHPARMRTGGCTVDSFCDRACCCAAWHYQGRELRGIPGASQHQRPRGV